MRNSDRGLFLQALMLGAGAMLIANSASAAEPTVAKEHDLLLSQAVKARSEKVEAAKKQLQEAQNLCASKDYVKAEQILFRLLNEFKPKGSKVVGEEILVLQKAIEAEVASLNKFWGAENMRLARLAASDKRYDDAIVLATEASTRDAALNNTAKEFVIACTKLQAARDYKKETTIDNFERQFKENRKTVATLLREGMTFYQNGKYDDARKRYELVFLKDPYNPEAIHELSKVYSKLYNSAIARKEADMRGMLDANVWAWTEPIFSAELSASIPRETEVKNLSADSIYSRMDSIIIPEFTFSNFNIQKLITKLNEMAKAADPEKRGINIALGLDSTLAKNLNVTMNFLQIPLSDLLRYLCLETGLKYRIEGDGIVIGTSDADMINRVFEFRGDLISGIAEDDTAETTSDSENTLGKIGEGKDFTSDSTTTTTTTQENNITSEDLKEYFTKRGISFGDGAKIAYDRRANRLFVTNTVENIRRLDELIRQLDSIKTPLVLVEIKLVEITENDWQVLGFQWSFEMEDANNPTADPTKSNSGWSMKQGSTTTTNSDGTSTTTVWNPISSQTDYRLVNDLKILPNFGTGIINGVNMNMSLSIDAISRNDRSEVLSAPKLLTAGGSTASIKLTTQYYFPSSWEAPEVSNSGDWASVTAPIPEWEEATDIGIILSISPKVDPDNYTISLELHPEVVSYIGKSDDYVQVVTGTVNLSATEPTYTPTQTNNYNVWMPILGRRKVDVFAKVYDGETIVIGGMVNNQTDMVRDKWPILGDLPLIGRLFSGESTKIVRRNLLIFVTSRLVNNDGVPIRQGVNRAIPDFNR